MNVKSWMVLAVLSLVLGLSACEQQSPPEGAEEPGTAPMQQPGGQQQ